MGNFPSLFQNWIWTRSTKAPLQLKKKTCLAVFKGYNIFHYRRGRISLGMWDYTTCRCIRRLSQLAYAAGEKLCRTLGSLKWCRSCGFNKNDLLYVADCMWPTVRGTLYRIGRLHYMWWGTHYASSISRTKDMDKHYMWNIAEWETVRSTWERKPRSSVVFWQR
jgi:hypothetical protein